MFWSGVQKITLGIVRDRSHLSGKQTGKVHTASLRFWFLLGQATGWPIGQKCPREVDPGNAMALLQLATHPWWAGRLHTKAGQGIHSGETRGSPGHSYTFLAECKALDAGKTHRQGPRVKRWGRLVNRLNAECVPQPTHRSSGKGI